MIANDKSLPHCQLVAVLACLAGCASLAPAALVARLRPREQIAYQPESYCRIRKAARRGKVKSVTINKRLRSLRMTLDGRRATCSRSTSRKEEARSPRC